jgi:hypothetical protein
MSRSPIPIRTVMPAILLAAGTGVLQTMGQDTSMLAVSGAVVAKLLEFGLGLLGTRHSEEEKAKVPTHKEISLNHHLTKLAGDALKTIIERAKESPDTTNDDVQVYQTAAAAVHQKWSDFLDQSSELELGTPQSLAETILGYTASPQDLKPKSDFWAEFTGFLLELPADSTVPLHKSLAQSFASEFAKEFYEHAKRADETNKPAAAALQFHLFGAIHALIQDQHALAAVTLEKVQKLEAIVTNTLGLSVKGMKKEERQRMIRALADHGKLSAELEATLEALPHDLRTELKAELKDLNAEIQKIQIRQNVHRAENKAGFKLVFTVLGLVAVSLAFLAYSHHSAQKVAEQQREELDKAKGIAQELKDELKAARDGHNSPEEQLALVQRIKKQIASSQRLSLDQLQDQLSKAAEAAWSLALAAEQSRDPDPGGTNEILKWRDAGELLTLAENPVKAAKAFSKGKALAVQHGDKRMETIFVCRQAEAADLQNDDETAESFWKQAVELAKNEGDSEALYTALSGHIFSLTRLGFHDTAAKLSSELMALVESPADDSTNEFIASTRNHARIQSNLHDKVGAEKGFRAAISAHDKRVGQKLCSGFCPTLTGLYVDLAFSLMEKREKNSLSEANVWLEKGEAIASEPNALGTSEQAALARARAVYILLETILDDDMTNDLPDFSKAEHILENTIRDLEQARQLDTDELLACLDSLANAQDNQENFDSLLSTRQKQYDLAARKLGEHHPVTLNRLSDTAVALEITGKTNEARELHEKCCAEARRYISVSDERRLKILNAAANQAVTRSSRFKETVALCREISELLPHHPHLNKEIAPSCYFILGLESAIKGDNDAAEAQWSKIPHVSTTSPEAIAAIVDFFRGRFQVASGQIKLGLPRMEEAAKVVSASSKLEGWAPMLQTLLGETYEELGRAKEAAPLIQDSLSWAQAAHDEVKIFSSHVALAGIHNQLGDAKVSDTHFLEAKSLFDKLSSTPWDSTFASAAYKFGILVRDKGDLNAAEPLICRAIETISAEFPDGYLAQPISWYVHASLLFELGRFSEGAVLTKKALDAYLKVPAGDIANTIELLRLHSQMLSKIKPSPALLTTLREATGRLLTTPDLKGAGTAQSLWRLADNLLLLNEVDAAEPLLLRAIRIDETQGEAGHLSMARNYNLQSVVMDKRDRIQEAETWATRGLLLLYGAPESTAKKEIRADLERNYLKYQKHLNVPDATAQARLKKLLAGKQPETLKF